MQIAHTKSSVVAVKHSVKFLYNLSNSTASFEWFDVCEPFSVVKHSKKLHKYIQL